MQTLVLLFSFIALHILVWYGSNLQLVLSDQTKALSYAVILSIPIGLIAFYATKLGHAQYDSLWTVRLLGFGSSYLVFPIMTYLYLNESPFNTKTMLCVILSFMIIGIQLFWKNT